VRIILLSTFSQSNLDHDSHLFQALSSPSLERFNVVCVIRIHFRTTIVKHPIQMKTEKVLRHCHYTAIQKTNHQSVIVCNVWYKREQKCTCCQQSDCSDKDLCKFWTKPVNWDKVWEAEDISHDCLSSWELLASLSLSSSVLSSLKWIIYQLAVCEDSQMINIQLHIYEFTKCHKDVSSRCALPCLRGGQALTPAQRWGRISSAQCASPKVTTGYK